MFSNNIYQAPAARLDVQRTGDDREYLLAVARRQKHLIYTFLAYIMVSMALANVSEHIKPLFQVAGILVFFAIIIFNVRLSLKLYGTAGKIIMITLGVIPLINFIVILIANAKANSVLKKAGIKVGFLGSNISDIERTLG